MKTEEGMENKFMSGSCLTESCFFYFFRVQEHVLSEVTLQVNSNLLPWKQQTQRRINMKNVNRYYN